jgi:oligopeptide/dipeptide ABC transporter ATP-binding protein
VNKTPLLEVRDLAKHFPIRQGILKREVGLCRAVDGVSFSLEAGEVVGIVGESGCGKSTLARVLIRLLEPTSGAIWFKGQDLLALSGKELRQWRPKAQMVFQDPLSSLNPRKTVGENITEAAVIQGLITAPERTDLAAQMLQRVGLAPGEAHRYPHQFSGGQQQRICIARALALLPELLICDEAVSALDVSVQAQILNLLSELKESLHLGLLFISHDLGIVRHFCDRVLVLYLGKVVESGPTEEVFAHPRHPYTQVLLSAIPAHHPRERRPRMGLKGELPSPANPPSGCPFHPRCPVAAPQCKSEPPPTKQGRVPSHHYSCVRS